MILKLVRRLKKTQINSVIVNLEYIKCSQWIINIEHDAVQPFLHTNNFYV